jgi:hypothetical protein
MIEESALIRSIEVDTGVDPHFLKNILTQDLTTLEAIIDMIDNSVDAAREDLLLLKPHKDAYGLPEDYSSYSITVRIDDDSVRILDNGCGINEAVLKRRAFYTGRASEHSYGIGYYGVGLKRALFKIGTNYAISTDDESHSYKKTFDTNSLGGSTSEKLSLDVFQSKKRKRTLFSVSKLHAPVKYDIDSQSWFDNAVLELETRYALYIQKGLKIKIYNAKNHLRKEIKSQVPRLRETTLVPPSKKVIQEGEVNIYVESGIHGDYRFPKEPDYNLTKNKTLTDSFGLYFICNDRVIVSASTEKKHGWKTKWHSEYNGFICLVRFVSEKAGLLPWNTAKTALKTDSTIFLKVRDIITPIANQYRSDIKARYLHKAEVSPLVATDAEKSAEVNEPSASRETDFPVVKDNTELSVSAPEQEPISAVVPENVNSESINNPIEMPVDINIRDSLNVNEVTDQSVVTEANHPVMSEIIEPAVAIETQSDVSSLAVETPEVPNVIDAAVPVDTDSDNRAGKAAPLSGNAFNKENRIQSSAAIVDLLNELNAKKLAELYRSICQLALNKHSALAYVGAWTFFEALSSFLGKEASTDFPNFFDQRVNTWYPTDRTRKNTYKSLIKNLNDIGNTTKHHGDSYPVSAQQLAVDFVTLEPFIVKCLQEALNKKNTEVS